MRIPEICILSGLVLMLPSASAFTAPKMSEEVSSVLKGLKQENAPVFVAECAEKPAFLHVLILRFGKPTGYYLALAVEDKTVAFVGGGDVGFTPQLELDTDTTDLLGGLGTRESGAETVGLLMRRKFRLVAPGALEDLLSHIPDDFCRI